MTQTLDEIAADVVAALARAGQTVSTAESCTGGLVAKLLTDHPGSSSVFELGYVTYSNAAKAAQLRVAAALLEEHGAVSEPVVAQMAEGARTAAAADIAVAISGIAGPGGGSAEKPVGHVCFAWATAAETVTEQLQFAGDREAIRAQSARHALQGVLARVR